MGVVEPFKRYGEPDIAGADYVLDLEVLHVHVEANFLNRFGVLLGGVFTELLRLSTSADHLTRAEDQSCSLRVSDTHDYGSETPGIVLSISAIQGNLPQVKLSPKIGS